MAILVQLFGQVAGFGDKADVFLASIPTDAYQHGTIGRSECTQTLVLSQRWKGRDISDGVWFWRGRC